MRRNFASSRPSLFIPVFYEKDTEGGGSGKGKGSEGDGDTITLSKEEFNARLGKKQQKVDELETKLTELTEKLEGLDTKDKEKKGQYETILAEMKGKLSTATQRVTELETFQKGVHEAQRGEWETISKKLPKELKAEFGSDIDNPDTVSKNLADHKRLTRLGLFKDQGDGKGDGKGDGQEGKGKVPDTDGGSGGKGKEGDTGKSRTERLASALLPPAP